MKNVQRYWKIEGFNGSTKIFKETVKVGMYSEAQMKLLLKSLVCKAGLGFNEIVGAYARRGTWFANDLLEVTVSDGPTKVLMCGSNPHFTARIEASRQ
tara:strand:- start:123 stop:416 length:294 start_codon:yes stop_codon:yes gene_type:complete